MRKIVWEHFLRNVYPRLGSDLDVHDVKSSCFSTNRNPSIETNNRLAKDPSVLRLRRRKTPRDNPVESNIQEYSAESETRILRKRKKYVDCMVVSNAHTHNRGP